MRVLVEDAAMLGAEMVPANTTLQCLSVQCMFCQQIRAKNTSRQRQHLQECPQYLAAMKNAIPANNLLHKFDEGEIARSIQLPTPSLELDFRMSVKLNPSVSVGPGMFGHRNWISFIGGSWAGRWGKGVVIVSRASLPLTRSLPDTARWTRLSTPRQRPRDKSLSKLSTPDK
jgi:Protein of unknown function (DUF3237)